MTPSKPFHDSCQAAEQFAAKAAAEGSFAKLNTLPKHWHLDQFFALEMG